MTFKGGMRLAVADVLRPEGSSRIVLACEHASHFIPPIYNDLGLSHFAALSHVAWDPGALEIAERMSEKLDAVLVLSNVSRLVYDCNRPPDAPGAVPERSEVYDIPGNTGLSEIQRQARALDYYFPFRELLAKAISSRGPDAVLVTIHTFTPVYFGIQRDVEIGILHDDDARLADAVLDLAEGNIIRRNEPYGPADGVTHTLREHGLANGILNVMIEVRNDLARTPEQCSAIAMKLVDWIEEALSTLAGTELRGANS